MRALWDRLLRLIAKTGLILDPDTKRDMKRWGETGETRDPDDRR